MLRRRRLGWALFAGLQFGALTALPAQVTITPNNSANLDPVARPQNASGQTTTFAVQYFAATSGLDQKFKFTCTGTNGITVPVGGCPGTKRLTSNAAAIPISVTFSTGAAGVGTLTVKVDQTLPSGPLTVTGRRDFTIAVPSATLTLLAPTVANMYRGVGTTATETFTLKNTGPGTSTYTLAVTSGSCTGALSTCSVSPASVLSLPPTATQTISVAYAAAAAGVQPLSVQASTGGTVVATGTSTITVLSAAMSPASASTSVTTSAGAQSYGGFTLVNAPNSPAMTVQLTAACTAPLTSCQFTSSGSSALNVSLAAGGAPSVPINFVAATAGSGTFAITAIANGVTVGGATLSVSASTPVSNVSVTLEPTPPANVVAGPTTRTYSNFILTNDPGSPATPIQLDLTCTVVIMCRFPATNTATMQVGLAANQSFPFPITYVAPTGGTGTASVDARVPGGAVLSTRTLTVNVQGAVAATLAPPNPAITVSTSATPQSYGFLVLKNGPGSPSATFNLTATCSGITSCVFSNNTPTISYTLVPNATQTVPMTFVASSVGSGAVVVDVASGGVSLTSATLGVTARAPTIAMTLTPATANMSLTASAATQTDNSFTLTNVAGSPSAVVELSVVCTRVSTCRLSGQSSITTSLAANASVTVPITYVANAPGTGSVTLRAVSNGAAVATATLTVTAQATGPGITVVTQGLTTDSLLYRDECVTLSLGSEIASECGDLRVVHALPAVRTLNVTRAPVMTYSSAHARVVTSVPAELSLPGNVTLTSTVAASLKINTAQYASGYWLSAGFTPGATHRVSVNVDNINNGTPSGVYPYTLEVTANTTAGSVITQSSGQFVVVNRATSPFGAGWWVAGLEQLDVNTPSRLVWYGGDGSVRVYNQRAGSGVGSRVWGAATASYPDSIREGAGNTYIRQLPDSVWVTFNANGQHVTTRNAKGHVTTFSYDGAGRLSQIAAPPGPVVSALTWTFNYNANGKLSSVTAPADTGTRTVLWNVNATTGRVDSIVDPGLPTRTIRFGYAAGNLMTSRTNGRGVVTRFQYDSTFHVSRASLIMPADSISRGITNWQAFGLTPTPASPASVRVALDGPRTGQLTTFQLNAYGAPTRVMSKVSANDSLVSRVVRGDPRYPALVTQSVSPANYAVDAGYDERGRILWQTAPATSGERATTWFTWDGKWDVALVVKNPEGDSTTFGVDPVNGNRLWQQDARGATARTTFTYDVATNQVESVTPPGQQPNSFTYDASRGNLRQRADEFDQRSYWLTNAIGLDTLVLLRYSTIAFNTTNYDTTRIAYSKRNEVLAKGHKAGAISDAVNTLYDEEGNTLTITRSWVPNPQNIAAQTTTVLYDNADRAVRRCESTGGCDSTVADSAGNARVAISRRAQPITMAYDLLNRLTDRSIPSDNSYPYPTIGSTSPATGPETLPFTRPPRPAETQHYHYHPSGQVDSATALDADVTRTYHASGALLSETLGIRDRARGPTPHTYTLTYEYDRNGRRTARTLGPSALFDATAMRTFYGSWGAVDSVTDIARNRFEFYYRQDGALISTLYPGGVQQTRTYDVFGRDSTDRIVRPGATTWPFFQDTLLRDFKVSARNMRGQIITASDAAFFGSAVPSAQYDSVGHLIRSRLVQPGYANISGALSTYVSGDTLTYDGLGNILTTRNGWTLGTTSSGETAQHTYDVTSGRLANRVVNTSITTNTTLYGYDAVGNARFDSTFRADGSIASQRASYYGADDRLIATDSRTPGKQLVEEYRYDALGRRVWVSTRWRCAPSGDFACLANAVTRTLWDGASEVAEIRAQYDTSAAATEELDAGAPLLPKSIYGDANPFFGRVVYGLGMALDQPLSVTRFEYRDNPDGADALAWPTFTLIPFWDYRGTPLFGLYSDGAYWKPYGPSSSTQCAATPMAGTTNRCVSVTWPFTGGAYHQDRGLVTAKSWLGSLLLKKKDVSGLTYARNRMYDPSTGRFTQEDPIGLAGGLNTYGFASGDPVNFGDPFGLEGCEKTDKICQIAVGIGKRLEQPEKALNVYAGTIAVFATGGLLAEYASAAVIGRITFPAAAAGPSFVENSNKWNHLFAKAGHNLAALLQRFDGNQLRAGNAIQAATQAAVNTGRLTSDARGIYQGIINVGGQAITVRGTIVDGVARIGTAFIPPQR